MSKSPSWVFYYDIIRRSTAVPRKSTDVITCLSLTKRAARPRMETSRVTACPNVTRVPYIIQEGFFRVFTLANTYNRSVYPPRLKPTAVPTNMLHILPSAVRRRIKSFLMFIRGDKVGRLFRARAVSSHILPGRDFRSAR